MAALARESAAISPRCQSGPSHCALGPASAATLAPPPPATLAPPPPATLVLVGASVLAPLPGAAFLAFNYLSNPRANWFVIHAAARGCSALAQGRTSPFSPTPEISLPGTCPQVAPLSRTLDCGWARPSRLPFLLFRA